MTKEFYKRMQKDINAWEKKHGNNIYSEKTLQELESARLKWASFK